MTVRIGIIGLGGMGRGHATYLHAGEVPGATLAAIADPAPGAHEWATTRLGDGVRRFDNAQAMMDSGLIDAVMIATPHYFHPTYAIAALGHGLHALVEKPAGVYARQVREMNEAAAQSDRVLGIMFNQRTRPIHQKMKELVASGEIGEIRRTHYTVTDWFRSQAYYDSGGWRATWAGEGGGVLVNQSPHNLDLFQWICGMPHRVRAFCGFGRYHKIEVEDDVTAYFQYPNGANGLFITSTGEAPGSNVLEITGDRGKLRMEGGAITLWRSREPIRAYSDTTSEGFKAPEIWKCEVPITGKGDSEEHRAITRNWVKSITSGAPLIAQGAEGIHGVQIANGILLSAWTDDWADLPTDEDRFYELLQSKVRDSQNVKITEGKALDFAGTF